ncbi:DUF3488 domain-containing protein [Legionella sp. km772]|nr:DUF3488 domain-containing protein [Legionella sp. km772]
MRYALFVTAFCYLPYLTCAPWWLLLFLVLSILYRLMSYYYGMKPVARSIRFTLIILSLIFLKAQYGSIISSNFYIGFLLLFIGLKIIEIHNERDLKVLVLCNFYLIFSALIMIQELWIVSYLLIAILARSGDLEQNSGKIRAIPGLLVHSPYSQNGLSTSP